MTGKSLATIEAKHEAARELSEIEDRLNVMCQHFLDGGAEGRFVSIGWTNVQLGLMAMKRGIYDGLRVTDTPKTDG